MSLVRLLTAGKSLVGLKEETSRYQMRSRHLLPKFGADKNPFTQPAAPTAAPEPAIVAPLTQSNQVPEPTPAEIAAAGLKETKRLPMASTPDSLAVSGSPAKFLPKLLQVLPKAMRLLGSLGRWARKLKPARKPALRQSPFRSAATIARPGKAPVQGELSLENIKVLRNDLSDTDVEIIPAKPPVKPRARMVEPAREAVEFAEPQST